MTKRYHRKLTSALSLVLPVILVFAILNCFTTYVFYEDYKYKMNLMTEIAAKEEFSGLDAVSELLKDKGIETNEQGRRLLEQYGYWGNKGNAFYSQFRHQVMVTGAVSTVICVLLLTFLLYWKKKEDACHQKILDQLEEILIRFRENKFDALLKTENPAELEKLNDQLEAIAHHIQLLKEEAREEKENTKEMVSDISHQLKTPVAAYYRRALETGEHIAYLVYDNGAFVGAGGVSFYQVMPTYHNPTGKKAYIMNMYAAPEYRRQGIAIHTLDLLVKDAKEQGVLQIALEATYMGRPLYERYGFAKMEDEMELVYCKFS